MDELTKQKKIRSVVRTSVTKYLNKLENEFDNLTTESLLEERMEHLSELFKQIKNLDNIVQSLIKEEKDFDVEINSAIDYNNKITLWNAKLSAQLKIIRRQVDLNVFRENSNRFVENDTSNRSIENVEVSSISQTHLKTVKLPKLNIEKYFGDPCNWLEFWNKFQNAIDKNESLSIIDKFSYLKSLLGSVAANVVNGFALTEANYKEALRLLEERFGRNDLVVNAHMNKLLNLYPVKDPNNIIGLRKLYDICEVQIRSLDSLNVTSEMYSHLLYPILIKLIPDNLSLEFNRKILDQKVKQFDVLELLKFLKIEIECRESAVMFQHSKSERKKPNYQHSTHKYQPNSNSSRDARDSPRNQGRAFVSSGNKAFEYVCPISETVCIYCEGKDHNSCDCIKLTVNEKRELLKKQARCFLCLLQKHRIKDCGSREMCGICNRKHNKSICFQLEKPTEEKVVTSVSHCQKDVRNNPVSKTSSGVLLQTCTAVIKSPLNKDKEQVRILLDNGSMRSFINRTVSQKLKLPVIRTEKLSVYAFGNKEATQKMYDVVRVHLENRDEPSLNIEIEALVTDQISAANIPPPDPNVTVKYKHLRNLQMADSYNCTDTEIVVLIGSDFYFDIVSGRIKRLDGKLVASETLFGWCVMGKWEVDQELVSMKVAVEEKTVCDQLKEFFELESLGINAKADEKDEFEEDIIRDFNENISFQNNRYKVKLPWKPQMKQMLDDNKEVACRRFKNLQKSFVNDPLFFADYQKVIEDYRKEQIVEPVDSGAKEEDCFYLPHRAVIRNDKSTSRLRIVFDASSHAKGKISLNSCLYSGPNLLPDIFLLLLKFRSNRIAVTSDIKAAFLQIEIHEDDRDFTRFFWDDNPTSE